MKKIKLLSALLCVTALLVTGCGKASSDDGKVVLRLAHTQTPDSQVAQIVEKFADLVDNSNTNLDLQVYTSGVLGSERDSVELVKAGVLDMAKISASSLDQFNKNYSIFSLPYVFQSTEHYYNALENSKGIKEIMMSGEKDGYIAIGFYASGARSAYTTKSEPATDPSKLKGLKIRVMESPTAKRMVSLMGGSPVPMAVGEVYTALQQGLLDGGENTEMALTVNKHGEVTKSYTYTEHQYTPDVFIISTKTWNKLSDKQKEAINKAIKENSEDYKASYTSMIDEAVKEAEKMGVKFYRIDKKPFIEAVQPMHADYKALGAKYAEYYDDIQKYIPASETASK